MISKSIKTKICKKFQNDLPPKLDIHFQIQNIYFHIMFAQNMNTLKIIFKEFEISVKYSQQSHYGEIMKLKETQVKKVSRHGKHQETQY